jgi:hypothetical protein
MVYMDGISDAELAFRVFVGVFVIVAPSALFVGLDRFLVHLRDDDLVNRALNRVETRPGGPKSPASVLTAGIIDGEDGRRRTGPSVRSCPSCGAPNPTVADYCDSCLSSLDG